MNEELKNEKKLKDLIFKIEPNKDSFNELMKSVTSDDLSRNRIMRDEIPSPYKSNYQFFVKKFAYIGVPVFMLAAYLIFVNTNSNDGRNAIQGINPPIVQSDNSNSDVKVADSNSVSAEVSKDASVDSIISGIISDSEADTSLAMNDNGDDLLIQNELNNYNSINLNNYDEII